MPAPIKIDEIAFSAHFRTGMYSNRALARMYSVSEGKVRKLAIELMLTRDLSGAVRAKVHDNLVRASVRGENGEPSDSEIVAGAAEQGTSVVLGHQRGLAKLRKTADMLSDQLEFAALHRAELEAMLKPEAESSARAKSLQKLLSLPTHAGIAKDLATVYQTIIRAERQALGLDEKGGSETTWEETLRLLDAEAA